MEPPDAEPCFDVAVAIPARSEAERIGACLAALAEQPRRGLRLGVFVLCNNCDDDTAKRARAFGARSDLEVRVHEAVFPPQEAHAGTARRTVMDWARRGLDPKGAAILCSTDADSCVAPDWLATVLSEIRRGADAAAGVVAFHAEEAAVLDLPPLRRLEDRYAELQARVDHLADPRDHDPWPNHLWAWGANLSVRAEAFDRAGGMSSVPLAEDRAFVARLEAVDAKVRHSPDVRVFTSARTQGRAPGGLADLVAAHTAGEALPCDAALEPIACAYARAGLRRTLRAAYRSGDVDARLLRRLRLGRGEVEEALDAPYAGEAWRRIEAASSVLQRRRLALDALPTEIARAERLLAVLSAGADRGDSSRGAAGALWSTARPPP